MVQKDMKKRSWTSLIIREIQTKTTPKVWEFSSMVDHLLSKCLTYFSIALIGLQVYHWRLTISEGIHDYHYMEHDSRQEVMVLEL